MAEMTREQQQALAIAAARLRLQEPPPEESAASERSLPESLSRQAGLTLRAAGPVAAGAAAGAAMGAPIAGVGAVPGAGIGAAAMSILQLVDQLGGTDYIEKAMDKLGIPRPESPEERVAGGATRAMAGMAGMAGGAQAALKMAPPAAAVPALEALSAEQGLGAASAAAGGGAGEIAREAGGGPLPQTAAALAASALAPAGVGMARRVGDAAGDVAATVGAAFGSQRGVERVAADAARALTKEDPDAIARALQAAKPYIHGAPPTVAEAVAERNLRRPEQQIGGALVKMQQELTGAKGVEDLLPTVARRQEAAVKQYLERLDERTTPMRQEAMQQAAGRTSTLPVIADVLMLSVTPGYRASDLATKVLGHTANKLRKLSDEKGLISPEDLYTVRMELGSTIKRFSEGTKNWDQRMTAGLTREIQRSIDNAIEVAGASGWKRYLETYSRGKRMVELHQRRQEAAKEIAKGVSAQSPASVARAELPTIPTLLHRPTMAVNFALKLIARDATEPVVRELAQRMADPKKFLELVQRPSGMPVRQAMDAVLLRASLLASLIQKHEQAAEEE